MQCHTKVASDLAGAIKALQETAGARYSVAWIDCLARGAAVGRSLIFVAEHASIGELAQQLSLDRLPAAQRHGLSMPFDLPSWTLNRATVAIFNALYFRRASSGETEPTKNALIFVPLLLAHQFSPEQAIRFTGTPNSSGLSVRSCSIGSAAL